MIIGFIVPNPGRQLLLHDLPDPLFPLHVEYDPVAAVIAYVHSEQPFLHPVGFPEIELPQTAIRFHQLTELNVPNELYLHKPHFEL